MEVEESNAPYDDQEEFGEAFDDFPFYDCEATFAEAVESDDAKPISIEDKTPPPSTFRRRRPRYRYEASGKDSVEPLKLSSSEDLEKYLNSRERKSKLSRKIEEYELKQSEDSTADDILSVEDSAVSKELSCLTDAHGSGGGEVFARTESGLGQNDEYPDANASSLLVLFAGIMIKVISFQFDLSVKFLTFPIWSMYYLYMLVFDPFGFLRLGRVCLSRVLEIIWNVFRENVSPFVYEWFREHKAIWKLGLKCCWGLLWSGYVCAVLVGLLMLSFAIGGLLIRSVVEEPIRMKRSLNFDYTEKSPLALVAVIGNSEQSHDIYLGENLDVIKDGGSKVIPPNHKLKVTVSLTLPESEYNQNLGIFQVRVDFLAADGMVLASSRRPCMLHYRSQPIRLLLTFLKVTPILTGYWSESQNLKINFKGFTKGVAPTSFLRVVLEQRAEFMPGGGIPEIYASSLTLESELPFLKKMIWSWNKSLFVWISMSIFTTELLFILVCCKSLVIPKIRLREEPDNGDALRIDSPNSRPRLNIN